MNKLKKIIKCIIVILISILGFYTTSNAEIGEYKSEFTFDDYYFNNDVYCLNYHQQIGDGLTYVTKAVIDLEGSKATQAIPTLINQTIILPPFFTITIPFPDFSNPTIISNSSIYNAKLAYILSQENFDGSGNIASIKGTGQVANAVWEYMPTWLDNCGLEFSGLEEGFATREGARDREVASKLLTEAEKYEQLFKGNTSAIKDETIEKDIKIGTWGSYNVVGPFKWVFPGEDIAIDGGYISINGKNEKKSSIEVIKQNGNKINNFLVYYYDGNTPYRGPIKSGREFYLFVDKNEQFSKLTIKAKGVTGIKKVRMYFLEAENNAAGANYQHYLVRERDETTNYKRIESQFTYTTPPMEGNLKIVKVNKDNQNVKLSGVGFIIKNEEGKYIRKYLDGSIGYVDKASATEFITNSNGEISINNLLIGTYTAYETKNPNYGYEFDGSGKTIEVNSGSTTQKIITNKQKYVKLSGKVWLDKISSKQSVRNNLYKSNSDDSADTLLNGITVRLKDRILGKTIAETKTEKGGAYLFKDILISELLSYDYRYYIEFEYDGLTYTNVVPYINNDNGSKAKEAPDEREEFNKNFSWVEGGENIAGTKGSSLGFTRYENGNYVHNLSYNISDHEATLINNGQYKIIAKTIKAGYKIEDHFTYGQEEIKNINLGLYKREQPDIAIVQDIENVKVAINGQWHTYNYASRFLNMDTTKENKFNVGVKFGEKYGNKTYTRAIYQADSVYADRNKDNELKVYVTYKITIRNESTTLSTVVHGIEDYFDSNYELYRVGSKLEANGNIATENNNIKAETPSKYNSNYMKTRIWNDGSDVFIQKQSEKDIYVQFKLNREAVLKILADKENLDNVVEIENYSVYDKNGDIYAGIDKDSNPNNCTPGNKDTYEDDTDSAPGLKLVLQDERTTSGKVFLDSTEEGLKSGEVRQGDGKYENGEKGVNNVEVTLLDKDNLVAKVYDKTSKTWEEAKTITDRYGNYTIKGYIPGEYKIVYTWGNKTYRVQDYKGTVYQTSDRGTGDQWYKYRPEVRYSDAMDNYEERTKIDEQTKIITNANKQAIEKYDNATIEKENGNKEQLITKMNSTTPVYKVNVEYRTEKTNSIDEYELDAKGNIKMNGDYVVKKDGYKNEIKNIDFGIVERAKQLLELDKRIKSATVTLANGHLLIDANAEKKQKTGLNPKYTDFQVKKPGDDSGSYLKIEVDAEIIQGATLDVVYGFEVTNKSELDFADKDFYLYGTIPKNNDNIVTLNPNSIIDYLDNNLQPEAQDTTNWNIIQGINQISDIKDQGLITEDVKTFLTNETSRILKQEGIQANLKPLYNNNTADNETMTSLELKCSKLLASNDYSIEENHAEVIKIIKSGGSSLITTPGNYNPKDSKTSKKTSEEDNSDSEKITVLNNTGLETDFIAYTWLAICSLGILGVGIVIIRKYIMK